MFEEEKRHPHWSDDRYWTEALEEYSRLRRRRKRLVLDLDRIEEEIFNGDSPAYKALEAFCSVARVEQLDGFRGAPRVTLALLQRLSDLSRKS
jgi:hypothetical protein